MSNMFSDSHELIVPTSRLKLVAMALGSLAFVLVGAFLLISGRNATIGTLSVSFFGFCGVYAVRRIIRPEPAVVINLEGIVDNASALSVGLIRWEEIAELREYQFMNQTFLGIVPKDLSQLLARQSIWKRNAIRANLFLGAAPVNIPQVVLPLTVSELLREIDRRFVAG